MNRKEKSESRRKRILKTAETILSKKGLDATISEIATAAKVPDSIIYHYFKNKEDLMFSVVGESSKEATGVLEEELKGIREPMSQMSKQIWFLLNRIDKEADLLQIALFQCRSRYSFYDHPAYIVHSVRAYRLFYRIMREGIGKGGFERELNIAVILNMVHGIIDMENVMLRAGEEPHPVVEDFDGIMDLIEPVLKPYSAVAKDKKDKAARILSAAEKVFGEKGYDQSTIQDVVEEANVAEGSVYWYFKNKEELLYSSFIEGFQRSADDFEWGSYESPGKDHMAGSIYSELTGFLKNFYMIAVKHPAFSKIFVMNGIFNRQFYESRAYELFQNFIDRISAMLDQGKADGSIRPEVDNRLFQNLVLGTFCQSVGRWHVIDNVSWHSILYDIELIVTYLLRAILVKKPGRENRAK
jgi:TetR/AcrR family transcriptional regulator, fatty acid metabolism regulator protein